MIRLEADLHAHTIASGHASSTVLEMATAATERGLDVLALTDHAPSMPGSCGPLWFANAPSWPRRICGVTVLRGVELDILDMQGSCALPVQILRRLDWIIASLHENVVPSLVGADCTSVWLAVAEDPLVDMIGHPEQPAFPFDMEAVVPVWAERGKIVEINELHAFESGPESRERAMRLAELCMRHGARMSVGSDAHGAWHVGRSERALSMIEELGIPKELIFNASSVDVLAHVRAKRPWIDL